METRTKKINDTFDLVETPEGDLMLAIQEQGIEEEQGFAKVNNHNFTIYYKNGYVLELSPFPQNLLQKLDSLAGVLVAEFSNSGLKKAYYIEIRRS